MNIAVVGATGMVGSKFIQVLQERNIKADNYYLYASSKSAGKTIKMFDKEFTVIELKVENIVDKKIDYALFSAGGSISKEYAPVFAKNEVLLEIDEYINHRKTNIKRLLMLKNIIREKTLFLYMVVKRG